MAERRRSRVDEDGNERLGALKRGNKEGEDRVKRRKIEGGKGREGDTDWKDVN